MIFLRYINHIKSYFFTELNEDNFYIKIIDLDEIYNFLVLSFSFEVVKMLKKINDIFRFKGIFDFSHLQSKLMAVAWRAQKSWSSGAEDR